LTWYGINCNAVREHLQKILNLTPEFIPWIQIHGKILACIRIRIHIKKILDPQHCTNKSSVQGPLRRVGKDN